MDNKQKLKVAKAIVTFDDAIKESHGISDLLGKIITSVFNFVFGSDVPMTKETSETTEKDSD